MRYLLRATRQFTSSDLSMHEGEIRELEYDDVWQHCVDGDLETFEDYRKTQGKTVTYDIGTVEQSSDGIIDYTFDNDEDANKLLEKLQGGYSLLLKYKKVEDYGDGEQEYTHTKLYPNANMDTTNNPLLGYEKIRYSLVGTTGKETASHLMANPFKLTALEGNSTLRIWIKAFAL